MKYFNVYRDGFMLWPIGIVSITRKHGIGFGVWYPKNDRLHIAFIVILSFSRSRINWKKYRESAGA
jgi:hypothetical protein